ncbi:MAG: hypothetical protein WBE13_02720 [Candidatus Acidiferrum sp.]
MFATEAGGATAEVGLLPFARIALQVSKAVLPRYRSRFSKHQFTQPQLLAILCLMRYEDWTFREAEVRLGVFLCACGCSTLQIHKINPWGMY